MLAFLGMFVQELAHPLFQNGGKDLGPAIYHMQQVQQYFALTPLIILLIVGICEGNNIYGACVLCVFFSFCPLWSTRGSIYLGIFLILFYSDACNYNGVYCLRVFYFVASWSFVCCNVFRVFASVGTAFALHFFVFVFRLNTRFARGRSNGAGGAF